MTIGDMGPVGGGTEGHRDGEEEDEKPRTLFVGNVPREIHKREIEEIFGDVGPLKRCYIQYPRFGNEKKMQSEETTVAYVTFALSQDATTALETLNNTKIGNNRINIKFAKTRSEQNRTGFGDARSRGQPVHRSANYEPIAGAPPPGPKQPRPKPIKKKSRLIVRNLSFKVTEEKMREYFQQMGDVKEVNILKKANGKLVGCAFIQYQNIFQAAKAIKELNLKPFLGRPIAIDWALPKQKFQEGDEKEASADDTIEIKDEPESEKEDDENAEDHLEHLKEEPLDEIKEESMDIDEIKEESEAETKPAKRKFKSESDSDEDDDDDDDGRKESRRKRPKQVSNDVEEGKTIFLRNLSFDVKEEELKKFFEKYGQVYYALLCKDSLTEHPKGTGFIKFKRKAAADEAIEEFQEDPGHFTLSGRKFNVSLAISRDKVGHKIPEYNQNDRNNKKVDTKVKGENKPKSDSRNLYLVREGFIRPGSGAAADISASDMQQRASLNRTKKQMLKNLNILISPTRLCVHNLPPTFSDKQLKKLFLKHASPGAKLREARIMRDMKDLDLDGKGKSKGYGFVNFTEHEHALAALRTVNNNPSIFKSNSRPIVEFSLENRLALKAKERRALKSQEKNPNKGGNKKKNQSPSNDVIDEEVDNDEEKEDVTTPSKKGKKPKRNKNRNEKAIKPDAKKDATQEAPKFAGLVAKKGVQTVPSFKPKGKITRNSLKQKKSKKTKKMQERRMREPKTQSKRPLEKIDKTEKIISKYKQNLSSRDKSDKKKKKWFE